MNEPFEIADLRHTFACWAASTAARTSRQCRFPVKAGVALINGVGLADYVAKYFDGGEDPRFDETHKEWRNALVAMAQREHFTHGVAAKLINVYLKAAMVVGHADGLGVRKQLHPPIDRLLLNRLEEIGFGDRTDEWTSTPWSQLNSDQYQALIDEIRTALDGEPLWMVEEHWPGHQ